VLAILGFYASRLAMPLPLFPSDEAAYLIRAIFPDDVVLRNPFVTSVTNGVHLSVIRAAWTSGGPFIIVDRLANAAAYLGGIVVLWRASVAGLPGRERWGLLLLALGFAYYRFAFSNLAEGLYVGLLALICVATGRWQRTRPWTHALAAGALCAALVLTKPHGLAVVAGLAAVALVDTAQMRDWRTLPGRALLFAAAFFAVGNLIQLGAQEPVPNPLAFFMSPFYSGAIGEHAPAGGWRPALLALQAMAGGAAVLAGPPLVIGLADLARRWRSDRRAFRPTGRDLAFLLLAASLGATLIMATVFAWKVAATESETRRLWGRYFEFFAPLLWLAGAPALARPVSRGVALASGAVVLAGLAALLGALQRGVVLFPWDASVLTAFFAPDPARAPLHWAFPYRSAATAAALLAAGALALRLGAVRTGLALILALSLMSAWLDYRWLAPMVSQRAALYRDIAAMRAALPPEPGTVILLTPDANDGHLGFLLLNARPFVLLGPPSQTPPAAIADAAAVVISGPDTPPGGPWTRVYHGGDLSLWRPAGAP
jgi:hypothetical protein